MQAEANERGRKLELNLKAQQYFFEVTEIEAWMNEKRNLLQTKDYGKDEDVARKLLAKHKVSFDLCKAIIVNNKRKMNRRHPSQYLPSIEVIFCTNTIDTFTGTGAGNRYIQWNSERDGHDG